MSNPQTEFDTPWKEIVQRYFEDFILFFFPEVHEEIEWTRGFEFLDKELQQVVRDAELGRRLVDKLVKIWRTGGLEAWLLIHLEVQSQEESNFAERMFTYHYRIYDRYRRRVASFAVLGDERSNWRPNQFGYEIWGTNVKFKFAIVKLLDYQQKWSELETSQNPFAIVVMAHLKAIETRNDRNQRKAWKLTLTRRLYEREYSREDVINLFQFIDWMMTLPQELEQQFWQELQQYEEEGHMPYITSVERIGIQQGLLEGISLGLRLKFGAEGLDLLEEISQIQDVEQLRAILAGIAEVNALSELRQIYQPANSD